MRRPSPGTLWRTLRHLRRRQILHQALHLVRPSRVRARVWRGDPPALALRAAATPFLGAPRHARWRDGRMQLLNRGVDFSRGIDWDHAGEGPLWAFHLHQFDWARDSALAPEARGAALLDWIARHREGTGWRPGPLSLRALAWSKLLATPGALALGAGDEARVRASLASQLETLAAHLERRLLANHYFSNLVALVAGGLAFRGEAADAWLRRERALREEIAEQVLPDGAHVERSPMYHALLLESVLDLLNLARAAPGRAPVGLEAALADAAERMLGALQVYTHPDGAIALFGDSAFGIAQAPADLVRYAAALGATPRAPARAGALDAAGYVRLAAGPWSLLVSVAGPLPPYQPGHAHCDALAFELCVGGERVVTDTGVCEYVPGPRRAHSRTTGSHATLVVDGREQAELWGAHRVGGRPSVRLVSLAPGRRVEATCAGWSTRDSVHRRAIEAAPEEVRVTDTLEGRPRALRLVLPLAPDIAPSLEGAALRLARAGAGLAVELPAQARWRIERAESYPEFGAVRERAVAVGEAEGPGPYLWRFRID